MIFAFFTMMMRSRFPCRLAGVGSFELQKQKRCKETYYIVELFVRRMWESTRGIFSSGFKRPRPKSQGSPPLHRLLSLKWGGISHPLIGCPVTGNTLLLNSVFNKAQQQQKHSNTLTYCRHPPGGVYIRPQRPMQVCHTRTFMHLACGAALFMCVPGH